MKISNLSDLIRSSNSEIKTVIQPDHPYLLEGPDILAASVGSIIALFFLKATEIGNFNKLFSRMALSRLALPNHTNLFFVYDNDIDINQKYHKLIENSFDKVINTTDLNLTHLLFREKRNEEREYRLKKVKDSHFIRHQVLYELGLKQLKDIGIKRDNKLDGFSEYIPRMIPDWFWSDEPTGKKSKSFLTNEKHIVVTAKFNKVKNKFRKLKDICHDSVRLLSNLDNGVPYMQSIYENNLLIPDELPTYKHDPNKTLRSMAFSGLAYSRVRSQESAHAYIKHITDKLEKAEHVFNKKTNRYNKRIDRG